MKLARIGVIFGLILILILGTVPAMANNQNQGPNQDNAPEFAADHILVKFKAETDQSTKQQIHGKHGGAVVDEIAELDVQVVKIPAGKALEKVNAYKNEKAVEYAELDYIANAMGEPDDEYFSDQWGMDKINAPEAWGVTTGDSTVKIAILDTGVDKNHEDLNGKVTAEYNNFSTSPAEDDLDGHGTHVAGIAAAATNNEIGVAGVGYDCMIMNVKVLDDTGSGYYSWIASGIRWAADNGAKVINMSLGGYWGSNTLRKAVDYAWGKGVVLVAAAGNEYTFSKLYPAAYTNCIAVAATDQYDMKADFSNYGASWVDVAAPGVDIYSTTPNNTYSSYSGTSMATPHVAGLAGLVWSIPSYATSNSSVRNRIESTAYANAGTGTYWQYGRIDAAAAVGVSTPPPTPTPTPTPTPPPPSPDFTISAYPTSQSIKAGASTSYTITLTPLNGYDLPVTLSVSGVWPFMPDGIDWTFSQNPISKDSPSSTLTLTTTGNKITPKATYTLFITGEDEVKSDVITVFLRVR